MRTGRRRPADPLRWFSPQQVERARTYWRPLRRAALIHTAAVLGGLAVVARSGAPAWLVDRLGIPGWRLQVCAVSAGLVLGGAVLGAPFGLWRTFVHERRWGFNRQTARGWLADLAKGLTLEIVLACALALGLWTLVRSTPHWWLLGWAGWGALSVVMAFAWPVLVAPLFNRFRPAGDAELEARVADLGRRAGVRVGRLLVADAGRRTSKHNAYVAGVGRTRRVVLWDTLLAGAGRRSVEIVVAHELGHWRRRHIGKGIAAGALLALPGFALLGWLLGRPAALGWAGAAAAGDPAAIPLAALAATALETLGAPLGLWGSRAWERQADLDALDLTEDADGFIAMERDLALRNLGELAPSRLAYLLSSHPPAPERMALAEEWEAVRSPAS